MIEVAVLAASVSSPHFLNIVKIKCPITHIIPPDTNAFKQFEKSFELGVFVFTYSLYSLLVISCFILNYSSHIILILFSHNNDKSMLNYE